MKSSAAIVAFVVFLMFAVCSQCTQLGFATARAAEVAEAPGTVRDLAFAEDTGASTSDGITNDSELVFTWTEPDGGGAVGYEYQLNGGGWIGVTPATVTLSPGEGAHTLEVRAVNALDERGDAVSIDVTVDLTGPVVASHSPSGQQILPVASVDVAFNEPIDAATFDVSDIAISGPGGAITPDSVTDQGGYTFRISFSVQTTNGAYSVLVGPGLDDLAGNTMDQDTSGTGGEDPADVYDASFTLAIPAEEVEPNDSRVTANMLPMTEDPAGSGFIMGIAIGTIDPATPRNWWSDPDYWGFTALGGDVVTLTVNTPHSDLDPYVELRDGADTKLTADDGGGPGSHDSLTGTYTIPTSGIYYVRIGKYYYSTVTGRYELRVDIARGIQLENDQNHKNDSIGGANGLAFETAGTERNATMAGTMMSSGDVDRFSFGRMNPGETVSLDLRLPSVSTLDGRVVLVNSSGTPVADDDGDATDGDFATTIDTDGDYYAQVQANSGSGTLGRYILDVTRTDGIPPKVTSVSRIPAEGGTTAEMIGTFTVSVSENMDASTVNVFNPFGRAYNGNYYFVTGSGMSWADAETYAQSIGGHLVTINDQAEQDFVQKWFCNYWPWIGLTDEAVDGTWVWASGDAAAYTNWASGEPNHGGWDYARMTAWGTWEDRHVSHTHLGLIELPAPTDTDGDGVPDVIDVAPADPLNTWDLRSDGGDGTFDNGNDVIYNLGFWSSYSSGLSLGMLVVRDGPLTDGHYRLTINSSMKDIVGNTLDGNGDLIGGDPYQRTFYVSTAYSVPQEGPVNSVIGQAAPLTLTEDPAGSGYFSARALGSQDPATSRNWWADSDYYSFEAQAGDIVSVSVDTPENSVDTYVELHNASDANLIADDNSGPKTDAFISHYTIPSDGTYYLRVGKYYYSTTPGNYLLRLDLARGIQMESDLQYNNDGISGADPLTLTTAGNHRTATVVGTVMESESTNLDEDTFLLGVLSAGMTVQVSTRLPSSSILMPRVRVIDSTGTPVSDDDGDPEDGAATITVPADGAYYARVDNPVWWYGGHIYRRTQGTMKAADAEAEAVGLGGHLATINDAAEQAWVYRWFGGSNLWIGMNDAAVEGTWEWYSGEAVTYTNWASAEPNSGNNYDWAYMYSSNGQWYDGHSTWNYWGVIEIDGAGSPDKAGAGPFGQYLLDVDVADLVPPRVNSLTRIPAKGGTTDLVIASFNVNVSEDLDPATVNAVNLIVRQYNGHYYGMTPSKMTWTDAETYAQGLGGNLVTIDDQAEQDFINRWFAGYGPWIGLNDIDAEGTWVWSSGDAAAYRNWASGEPNTASYDAAYINGHGEWYDSSTTSSRWGLVEVPVATDTDGDGIPDLVDALPSDRLNAWELRSDGGDGIFDNGNDIVYTIRPTSTYSAGTSINFTILDGPLAEGSYRFTANTTLTDMVGNVIDGDGDGTGGDKYEHFFTVAGHPSFVFEGRMNNSVAAAPSLALVEDPPGSGHFLGSGFGSLDPYVSSSSWSDSDAFKFEAQAGDKVSISTDTPDSGVDPYTYIYDATTNLVSANNEGPYNDDYISYYTIPATGTYWVWVRRQSATIGTYEVHVQLARDIDLESDRHYNNDSIANADPITLQTAGTHRTATVAGKVMDLEYTNTDEDIFHLGLLSTGAVVELSVRLPSVSRALPRLKLLNSSGAALTDEDGDPEDDHCLVTITDIGNYYARIDCPIRWHGGSIYIHQTGMPWANAEAAAQALGGHLVTINDEAEKNWLHAKYAPWGSFWTGFTDQAEEGTWVWASGEPVTYTAWYGSEPNSGNTYNWAYQHSGHTNWYDQYASWGGRSVVEIPGAGDSDEAGAGPMAFYLLDIDVADVIPPLVTSLSRIPADGGTTDLVLGSFNVNVSEDMAPATVNAVNPMVREYNGHHYFLTPSAMTWTDAETYAQGVGGNLATIDDQAEQDFVERWFAGYSPWIGLNDIDVEATWVWSSGDAAAYRNWASGEPNTASYDAAYMNGHGQWYDYPVTNARWGLVELPAATDTDNDGIPDDVDVYPADPLNTWDLRSDGGDGIFDNGNDVVYSLAMYSTYTSGTAIKLTITDGPLAEGSYRFTANNTITDLVGNVLDGDADGTGGDKYEHFFTVAGHPSFVFEGRMNNSAAAAPSLALVEDPPGSGHFVGSGFGSLDPYSSSSSWGDSDAFSFEAQAGDKVSVSTDTPDSGVDPYTYIYNATSNLTHSNNHGPYNDDYISYYTIPATGTYWVWVRRQSGAIGTYEVHVQLARDIDLESDRSYNNDSIANADPITLQTAGIHRTATVAGKVMDLENTQTDEDTFQLGSLSTGTVVELSVRLPSVSRALPRLRVLNSSGTALTDEDGDPEDDHCLVTIPAVGNYYARIDCPIRWYGGSVYVRQNGMPWADAEAAAQAMGGHLVTINDEAEKNWLHAKYAPWGSFWIGFTDDGDEGNWRWVSGAPVTYTSWHTNEPNSGASYNWAYQHSGNTNWYDQYASWGGQSVVEIPGAGSLDEAGAGPMAFYLLDVDISDEIPPQVTSIPRFPDGGTTTDVIGSITVNVSEDMDASTVNASNPLVREHNGHHYFVTDSTMTWADAETYAQGIGGYLAAINDQAEQDFINRWFAQSGPWIGLTDQAVEGTWEWTSGEPYAYANWYGNEPNSGGSYDWAYMNSVGVWYDDRSTTTRRGLIELPAATDTDGDGVPDAIDALPADAMNTWDLRGDGGDGIFGNGNDVVYTVRPFTTYTSGMAISLEIIDGPLDTGYYRFTANSTLTDVVGNALDGNADGTGGDPHEIFFSVDLLPDHTFEGRMNNGYAAATPLPLNEDPAGSGYFIGRGIGSLDPADPTTGWYDSDAWSIQALAGDRVGVSVDTPNSSLDPLVYIYILSSQLAYDNNGGPGNDGFISHYTVPSDGTYWIWVVRTGSAIGSYQLRVELARGIDLESDREYNNDSVANADPITLTQIEEHRSGAIAGTLMSPQSANVDEDYFNLGEVQDGETIFLSIRPPEQSLLRSIVEIRDSTNSIVTIAPNPSEGVARADITIAGYYYAVVVASGGHGPYGQYILDAAIWPSGALEFADLVITSVTAPATADSGETIPISWDGGNFGTGATDVDTWHDRIVLSVNDRYGDADDILLTSVMHTGTLAIDETYLGSASVQLPLGISGTYYVLVNTDVHNAVFEYIFEGNNVGRTVGTITITQTAYADLEATNVGAPPIGVVGEPITITWSGTNRGSGTTGDGTPGGDVSAWFDRIIFSPNTVFGDGDDVFIDDVPHTGALDAGISYPGSWTAPLPGGLSGDYNVFVFVDYNDAVFEFTDDYSNLAPIPPAAAVTIGVATGPYADLTVTGLSAPDTAHPGEQITVDWVTNNTNNASVEAPAGPWRERVHLSDDEIYGDADDRYLGEILHSGPIAVGASDPGTVQVTIPSNVSGRYWIFVKTDRTNVVYEYVHEGNNVSDGRLIHIGDWYVDDDAGDPQYGTKNNPFNTIQQAVDAALSGYAINVAEGLYTENLVIDGKELDLLGGWDAAFAARLAPGASTIDGGAAGPTVQYLNCPAGELSGFAIINGAGTSCGVHLQNSSPTVAHNIITGNSGDLGGGVSCDASSPNLISNTITGNTATTAGGGIYCTNGSSPTIGDTILWGNSAPGGAEIAFDAAGTPSTVTIDYSDVAGGQGGALAPAGNILTWGANNIDADPLFADAAGGDFHLKSKEGRWDPAANGGAGDWALDAVHSPCIDRGDSGSDYAIEPEPNKALVNLGAYGNTAEASKSFIATLTVESTPISGVAITGDKPGDTNYSALCDVDEVVNLTAPATVVVNSVTCTFVRWILDAVDQPDSQATVQMTMDNDHTVVALYSVPLPVTSLTTSPAAPNGNNNWFITKPQMRLNTVAVGQKKIHYWWNADSETVVTSFQAVFYAPGGVNTLHYFGVDGFDQAEAEQTAEIKYDDSTPTVSIGLAGTLAGAGWYTGDVTATVTSDGDGVAIASTEYRIDGGAWTAYTAPIVVSGERYHTVRARIETANGKTVQTSKTFTIDTNPPTTILTTVPGSPNGNDGWFITQPQMRLTATDAGAGVKEIRYWWNSDAETIAVGGFVAFNAPGGINTLHFYAVDQFDQAEAEQTAEIKYDDSAPTVSIGLAGPLAGPGWYTGDVTATVTADGDGIAIVSTEYRVDYGAWTAYTAPVVVSGERSHNVRARIETANGKSVQTTETFTIDFNPPTTALSTVPSAPNGPDGWFVVTPPQIRLNASDAGSGVKAIHYWWNAGAETVVPGSYTAFAAPIGTNTLHYFAVDNFDQAEAEKQQEIKFDDSAPDLEVTGIDPIAPVWSGTSFDVTFEVTNNGSWAAMGNWYDRVYLSDDDQFGGDVYVGTVHASYPAGLAIGASYSRTVSVSLPDGIEGQRWIIVRTDVHNQAYEENESNNERVSDPFTINMSPYPDLQVTDVVMPLTGNSGEQVEARWTVTNAGDGDATGTWRDKVYLSDDNVIGNDQLLGTFPFTGTILAGNNVERTGMVTLPGVNVSGDRWIVVKTDADSRLFERMEGYDAEANNEAIDDLAINIPPSLSLTAPLTEINEDAVQPTFAVTVERNTHLGGDLLVTLLNDDPTELDVPADVTIPDGLPSATFNVTVLDDTDIDGTQTATISASAAGFTGDAVSIDVIDNEFAALTLEIEANELPEGGAGDPIAAAVTTATVTRNTDTTDELIVTVTVNPPLQIDVPATVTIPATQASATFDVTAIDNSIIDGTVVVTVTVSATGFVSGSDAVDVVDDDLPTLSLAFNSTAIVEGAVNPATFGTVTRSAVSAEALEVRVSTDDITEAVVFPIVVILPNEASAMFPVNAVDDDIVDGTQTVTISAFVTIAGLAIPEGQTAETIDVTDDDGPTLTVTIDIDVVSESAVNPAATGTVYRNTDTTDPLEVALESNDVTEATVAPALTIPAGSSWAPFDINAVSDGVPDGLQMVLITASAAGFNSGVDIIGVTDVDRPDLRPAVIDLPTEALTGETVQVTWEVTNDGLSSAIGIWGDALAISTDDRVGADTPVADTPIFGPVDVGGSYQRTLDVTLPTLPGQYWIIVTTDTDNEVEEIPGAGEQNNTAVSAGWINISQAYTATVQADVETAPAGTPIPMTGSASHSITGDPAPFVPVSVRVRSAAGFRRVIDVITDANGEFEATFTPLPTEGGVYEIGAEHPDVLEDPTQDTFTLLGIAIAPSRVSHQVYVGEPITASVEVRNLTAIPLTGMAGVAEGLAPNLNVSVEITEGLPGSGTIQLSYTLDPADVTYRTNRFGIRVTSAEGVEAILELNITMVQHLPRLVSTPGVLETGMLRGEHRLVPFIVRNVGGASSGELPILLPDVPWISVTSSPVIPTIEPGGSAEVILALDPPVDLPLTLYNGSIVLAGSLNSLSIPFRFRAISDALGDLQVTVEDEYTYFAEGTPNVEGATVELLDPIDSSVVATMVTGPEGVVTLTDIPEGDYLLKVRADRHSTYRAGGTVVPGITTEVVVFLARQTVTYNWTVVPIEIEDHYKIVLEAVFETNVPIPVVTVDNPFIMPLVVEGETTQVDIQVTNHGLIAAEGLNLNFGVSDTYEMVPLIEEFGQIPAKTTVVIPFLLSLKEGVEVGGCSSCGSPSTAIEIGGGCDNVPADVSYYYVCGDDEKWHRKSLDVRPIKAAKSIWDCMKAIGYPPEVAKKMKGNMLDLPSYLINVFCTCMDLGKCTCAILKIAGGIIAGAAAGGWGAIVGGIKNLPGLWDCVCFEIDLGWGSSPSGGGPRPDWGWDDGWGSPGGGGAYIDPVDHVLPSPGCTPGDIMSVAAVIDNPKTPPGQEPASSGDGPGIEEIQPAEEQEGVCARVRIRLEQDLVMTRTAFLGTLELNNGDETTTLEGISLTLNFKDMEGNPADDLFAVRPPEVSGMTAVDGTGTLGPGADGTARYIIVPTTDAAPEEPTRYQVGGTLRYIDRGEEIVMPLFPATITVYPDASLRIRYFWQRDVYSDDPFTDEIEASEPFSLGVMITNVGKGDAGNLSITSSQPEIIENEKGLLIEFEIIGTQVGSEEVQPSLTVSFGNILAGETGVARWLMTSTLQGKFIEYTASYQHVNAIGDKEISLIESLEIFELIHVVQADRPGDDDLFDFLVNAIEDEDDLPDTAYFSDGSLAPVELGTDPAVVTQAIPNGLQVELTSTMPVGWGFLRLVDPGGDDFVLTQVTRSDGKEIMIDENAWTTHRWNRPVGQAAYREHLLNLFDYNSGGSYTLIYGPNVRATDETPPESSVAAMNPVAASPLFLVQWSGQDPAPGSGLSFFDVFVSVDGGDFTPWKERSNIYGGQYMGEQGKSYAFYTRATDHAGNREDAPAAPDAETYIPDLVAPPITVGLDPSSDGGVPGDNITNDNTPKLIGITEPLATVTLVITGPGDYSHTDATQADETGQWSYTVGAANALPEGLCTVNASAVDAGGNSSLADAVLALTIDTTAPTSAVAALPATSAPIFKVQWSAQDEIGGSGLADVDVLSSDDGAAFTTWQAGTTDTSAWFGGLVDHGYGFYSIARDVAGNQEQKAPAAEAETSVTRQWALKGDVNMDCIVNILDLIFVRNRLLLDPDSDDNWQANVNLDEAINILDMITVRNELRATCPE